MSDEPVKKKVDESWKEQAEREKRAPEPAGPAAPAGAVPAPEAVEPAGGGDEVPQARFDLFVSGLATETLIALGEIPHPVNRKRGVNLPQARYLIDLLGVLEDKTKGNLAVEEEKLLTDVLYQLRMRYLTKAGKAA